MLTLKLFAAIFVVGSVQDPAGAPLSRECEAGVQSVLQSISAMHWNPLLRARASRAEALPRTVCRDGAVMQTGVQRALDTFDDPAMRLLDGAHFNRMLEEWNGAATAGIGLTEVLSIDTDEVTRRLTVISPVPESPAASAGLAARDVVTAIDGTPTDELGLTESMKRLRVEPGASVSLEVLRGDVTRNVVLRSAPMPELDALIVRAVEVPQRDVVIIHLRQFTPGVGDELRALLKQRSDASAIILDLRGNPGGLVPELVAVAGVFLKQGSTIARVTGPDSTLLRSEAVPVAEHTPVIVLMDAATASAAEVLAGALRTAGARLYGARTFGKGLAHQAVPVTGEWMFMLPVAQLETPEGRRVLRNGIDPDVRTSNALDQALRDLRRGNIRARRTPG